MPDDPPSAAAMPDDPPDDDPEDLVPVGRFPDWQAAQEAVLVILALDLAPAVAVDRGPDGRHTVFSNAACASTITRELDAYAELQRRHQPPPKVDLPVFSHGAWLTLAWATALLAAFLWQRTDPDLTDTFANRASAVFDDHQWWRPLTALFLHADLAGNLASGTVFATLAARSLGPATTWLLTFAGGAAGNTLTAALHHPQAFSSIGASTGVFATLGLLTGYGFYVAFRSPANAPWASVLLPLGGGFALLAWLGSGAGSPTTDVLGHLLGFAAGTPLGVAAAHARLRHRFLNRPS